MKIKILSDFALTIKKKPILFIIAVILLFAIVFGSCFAWISFFGQTELSKMNTSGTEKIIFSKTVRSNNAYSWVVCENARNDELQSSAVVDEQLNFGSIDNVAQLKDENVVYFKLKIPKTAGKMLQFTFDFVNAASKYTLSYFPNGENNSSVEIDSNTSITPDLSGANVLQRLNTVAQNSGFLRYCYAFSDSDTPDFAALQYSEFLTPQTDVTTSVTYSGDYKYMYIKLLPLLESYLAVADVLTPCMPCVMSFNVYAKVTLGQEEKHLN